MLSEVDVITLPGQGVPVVAAAASVQIFSDDADGRAWYLRPVPLGGVALVLVLALVLVVVLNVVFH